MILSVTAFKPIIQQGIIDNRVLVIEAPLGTGKSTQIVQYAMELDMSVMISQIRRMIAIALARRVSEEMGTVLGELVGYRTGYERRDSDKTKCLFTSDGFAMMRELHKSSRADILIIDDAHDPNLNVELLIALAKKEKLKVVLMSGTMDSGNFLEFFGEGVVIKIPGTVFPVKEVESQYSNPADQIAELVKEKSNVLVFLSGKGEISKMQQNLERLKVEARILQLHGEQTSEEQQLVFTTSLMPTVILSTDISQNALTIDYIDAVVDMGEQKQMEVIDGIETLVITRASKASEHQRKFRAGRCKPGRYFNYYRGNKVQLDYDVPEIWRVRLDQLCLRLKISGYDAREFEFRHQPEPQDIADAMQALYRLGAIDKNELVTDLGKAISRLPISVHIAAMIIASIKYHVLDDVLTIAACLEAHGLLTKQANVFALTSHRNSDLLAMLEIYNKALNMTDAQMKAAGIHVQRFYKAKELRYKLSQSLLIEARNNQQYVEFHSTGNTQDILRACLAGMVDNVYFSESGKCRDANNELRSIDDRSVVDRRTKQWIVGIPINLQNRLNDGSIKMNKLVVMVSEISMDLLKEIAPQVVSVTKEVVRYESLTNTLRYQEVANINGRETREWVSAQADWNTLDQYMPVGTDLEELRLDAMDALFKNNKQGPRAILAEKFLGSKAPAQNTHQQKQYGLDPKTKQPLIAYPGVVKRKTGFYLEYFKTEEEAVEQDLKSLHVSRKTFVGAVGMKGK